MGSIRNENGLITSYIIAIITMILITGPYTIEVIMNLISYLI